MSDDMEYLVKIGELGQKIDYLEKQLSIIDENISSLKAIKSNIVWEGQAALKFSDYHDNYINELIILEDVILESIKYLKGYYTNFGNEYLRMRKSLNNLSNEEK